MFSFFNNSMKMLKDELVVVRLNPDDAIYGDSLWVIIRDGDKASLQTLNFVWDTFQSGTFIPMVKKTFD